MASLKEGINLTLVIKETGKKTVFEQVLKRLDGRETEFSSTIESSFRQALIEDMKKRFESSPPTTSGGVVAGGRFWQKLTDSYLTQRPDRALGKIYIDTGALKTSLTTYNVNMISTWDGESYEFGTKIPYAQQLQKYRPIVFWHKELVEKLAKVYIAKLLNIENQLKQ
jgi:hypothetical protein